MPNEMEKQKQELARKRPTYLTLIGIFVTVLAFFGRREQREARHNSISPYDLVLLGIGSYRMARLLAFDQVTQPIRATVAETKPGGEQEPKKGSGVQTALGEMITCDTCIGTWVAAALTYAHRLAPTPTRLFLVVLTASGVAEVLSYTVDALDAVGKAANKQAES